MRALFGLWLLSLSLGATALTDQFPGVATAYRVEIDGIPTWEGKARQQLPPASLTKLMTALLALEQGGLERIVTISPAAAQETGTRLQLKSGERYRLQDLLAAALMASANDACHALADAVAGSEADFVKRMNRRAAELGMLDTHFVNACGHDARGHLSSAHDLALLAHEVIRQPALVQFTSRIEQEVHSVDGARRIHFENRNELVGRYRGAFGLKTGYTSRAGNCLIAYAKRGETTVLLVMLHGKDRWWDAVDILDVAFEQARQTR